MSLQMAWEQLELFPLKQAYRIRSTPAPAAQPVGWPDARHRTAVYRPKSAKTADTGRFHREETKQ